jgi:hypothetical protein
VRIWSRTEEGDFTSKVEAEGRKTLRPEDFAAAQELDTAIDAALDQAVVMLCEGGLEGAPVKFTANWAIGRALTNSNLLKHPALGSEDPRVAYSAATAKARCRVRSDGSEEASWERLRPSFEDEQTVREGGEKGKPDHWQMCIWLAEQDFDDAVKTFGGSTRNVWQMIDRKTLRPLVLRQALRNWLASLPPEIAKEMTSAKIFPELMKALRKRWPALGRRPAKQPVHYTESDLRAEIERVAERAGLVDLG